MSSLTILSPFIAMFIEAALMPSLIIRSPSNAISHLLKPFQCRMSSFEALLIPYLII
jgi:hypothetical protein